MSKILNTVKGYFTPSSSYSEKELKINLETYKNMIKKYNKNNKNNKNTKNNNYKINLINSLGNLSRFDKYKDEKGNTILHIAIENNWIPVVRMLLLREDANYFNLLNNDGDTPLIYAIKKKNIEIIKILLDNSEIDINLGNKDGYTPLMNAILEKLPDIALKILAKSDINVNLQAIDGSSALYLTIVFNLPDIADKILDKSNVDVNLQYKSINKKTIKTPLIMAISKKYSHITLKILAKPNVDVNLQDEIGNSALIYAISINNIDIIDKILKIPDVNVNIKNNDGEGILHYFDLFLSDSDSINFIKIIATIIIKKSNNNNFSMINYKKKNYNNKSSSTENKLNFKKNLIEPPQNLNFIDIHTLEYFKQQNKNNGINKNVLTEIRKLMIGDNQGLIKGHGGTLPNEVCLIPHNLALFFPVQKSCSLYSNEIKFINKKNTRKKLVNIKLKNKTGKILPGGTITSNMIINFKSTYNGKGSQPKNIKDITSFSYSGVITKNYDYLNNNYLKNDNANKYIKKSVKAYENELKNINIELKKILELNIENEEFISFQKTKYFFQFAKLIREMIEIRKKRFVFFLSASQKQAIKEGNTNMLKKINADIMKSHNSEIIEANKIYGNSVRLSNILQIISEFKSNNPDKNIPTLFHIYACRNMLASNLKENSEIHSGKKLSRRQSFSLEYIKTNFNFFKKLDKKIDELSKDKNFMEIKIGEKELYSKILNFYKDFKKLLESKCTAPIWQYNFFNTILETPVNNIEASIAEFKKELEKY